MKEVVKNIIEKYLTFLPLFIFVYSYRMWSDWQTAFIAGGIISVFYILFILYKKVKSDMYMIGVNCFLIGGAAMYVLDIGFLQYVYDEFLYSTIFIWIFIVGLVSTFLSPRGFIGLKGKTPAIVRKLSFYLLFGSLCTIGFSFYFSENIFIAGVLPFVFLLILRSSLQKSA